MLRRGDVLARLGGDEFAVLLTPNLPHRGALGEVATRLHAALIRPFEVRGVTVELGGSIGIAVHGRHGDDMRTLLRRADVAMYEAKREHTHIETYDPERDPYSADRLTLLASCGPRSTAASSSCTSSPRCASRAATSSASRRSCAGTTPSAACCRRSRSCRWRRARA